MDNKAGFLGLQLQRQPLLEVMQMLTDRADLLLNRIDLLPNQGHILPDRKQIDLGCENSRHVPFESLDDAPGGRLGNASFQRGVVNGKNGTHPPNMSQTAQPNDPRNGRKQQGTRTCESAGA